MWNLNLEMVCAKPLWIVIILMIQFMWIYVFNLYFLCSLNICDNLITMMINWWYMCWICEFFMCKMLHESCIMIYMHVWLRGLKSWGVEVQQWRKLEKIGFCNGDGLRLRDGPTVTASRMKMPNRQWWHTSDVWRSNRQHLMTTIISPNRQRWQVAHPGATTVMAKTIWPSTLLIDQNGMFDSIL